ncbi:MAG: ribosome silencing factor [Acidimicrobiia bacterium]
MTVTRPGGRPVHDSEQIAQMAADAIDDKKGFDVELLEVGDLLAITEIFVIATGTSRTHVRAVADGVEEALAEKAGRKPLRREGADQGEWVLLDYGDVVVHLFQPEQRDYYGLERLWRDAPKIVWEESVATDA